MPFCLRHNIKKGQRLVIFINDLSRNLTSKDFSKNIIRIISHTGPFMNIVKNRETNAISL